MERSLYLSATCRQRYCTFQHRLAVRTSVISHRQRCLSVTYHAWVTPSCLRPRHNRISRFFLLPLFTLVSSCSCTLVRTAGSVRRRYGSLFSPVEIDLPQFPVRSPLRMNAACSRKVVRSRMRVHWSCGEIEPGDIPPRSLLARFMVHFPAERVDLSVRLATADTITAQTQNNYRPYMTAG